MLNNIYRKLYIKLSQTQFIAFGFIFIITIGTLLLMLPFASRSGESAGFLTSLFTSTSATCVTGLVVTDTYSQWTICGQVVILILIQIGGLGFITIGIFLAIFLRRKIGLKERGLMQESANTLQIGGVIKLAKKILFGTLFFEGSGALILAIRFIPQMGLLKGLYYGIFHSISAFCNAGFDLMGFNGKYSSFSSYYDDWMVNLVLMTLIVVGGIGFIVWDDLSKKKLRFRKYRLHTKLVLLVTIFLIFGGAVLFYHFEDNNLMADMNFSERVLTSLFSSVTARTAGFNTIDTGKLTHGSRLLTIILMFIGGSPGSTAGGIKTTTVIVLLLYVKSNIRRTYGVNVFGRRLEDDAIKHASSIVTINMLLALTACLVIMAVQGLDMTDVIFEAYSAIGTVGMSTGITRSLKPISKIMIIILMYGGRIGSLSFALSFTQQKKIAHVQFPVERITIG